MIIFFIALTLGFVFELGKNALTIDSKQVTLSISKDKAPVDIFVNSDITPNPHAFTSLPLQSSLPLYAWKKKYEFSLYTIRAMPLDPIPKYIKGRNSPY